jgi:hypothetical protein
MNNFFNIDKKHIFPIFLILILALARLIPHPPNFTPIITVAIMSSYFFRNIYLSLAVIIVSMLLADVFIGFYNNMIFVYLALILVAFVFFKMKIKIKFKNLFVFGFLGSIIFFIISNFGVWALTNTYEKNLNGLIYCYFMALPFFTNTLISTIFFSYATFIADNLFKKSPIYR